VHDGPVHRHPLQAQLTGGFHRYERVRRYPASVEFGHVGSPHDRASSVLRFRPPRFASLGGSLDNRPRPTTAASSMTGRSIGPSRENGGRTPDGRRVGFRRVDSLPAKTAAYGRSRIAPFIVVIVVGGRSYSNHHRRPYLARTSLPAVYRAIDPPRASARSRYRPPPEEFVPSPFVVGRSTRTGTGNPSHEEAPSRVVPRELSGRHRPGRRIIPFPSTKIRIRVAFRTAAELSTILDDSLSGEFGKPGGRRRRATRQVHG